MQLTNIARDIREDWDRGRCYLPADWFAAEHAGNDDANRRRRSRLRWSHP